MYNIKNGENVICERDDIDCIEYFESLGYEIIYTHTQSEREVQEFVMRNIDKIDGIWKNKLFTKNKSEVFRTLEYRCRKVESPLYMYRNTIEIIEKLKDNKKLSYVKIKSNNSSNIIFGINYNHIEDKVEIAEDITKHLGNIEIVVINYYAEYEDNNLVYYYFIKLERESYVI